MEYSFLMIYLGACLYVTREIVCFICCHHVIYAQWLKCISCVGPLFFSFAGCYVICVARLLLRRHVSGAHNFAELLKGSVRLSTQFLFTVRDTLPATVVLGRDWFAFCCDILHSHPEVRLPLCQWMLAEDFALPSVSPTGCSFAPVADTCIMRGSPWWDNFRCLGPNPRPSAVSLCFSVPKHSRTSWENSIVDFYGWEPCFGWRSLCELYDPVKWCTSPIHYLSKDVVHAPL